MGNDLPRNTVVRLSQYRRLLEKYKYMDEPFIFSHDLARMLDLKPVNVRHDFMLLGMSGDRRKGYSITSLLGKIAERIDCCERKVILVGLGRLGMSLAAYLSETHTELEIKAAFDVDPDKINRSCEGIPCYSISDLGTYIENNNILTAVLTIPPEDINHILPILIDAGVKGILNYTSETLQVPEGIVVRNVDIVTFLEEINYFIKPAPESI